MSADTAQVQDNRGMAATKLRNIRVDDALWREAMRIATERRETLSAVLKRALVEYVEAHGGRADRDG